MARLVNDIVAKLFLNSDWRDISSDIRYAAGCTISRGKKSEDDKTPPQTCTFTLDNTSGDYTERDPMGQWHGFLGRNTPFQLSLRTARDTMSATVSNGWGTTEADASGAYSALSWTVFGTTSNYAKAAGKATHALTSAGDIRVSYLAAVSMREVDVTITFNIPTSNITGSSVPAGIAPANILLRGQGALSDYLMLRLVAQTDETYTMDWWAATGGGNADTITVTGAETVPNLTQASQDIKVRVQVEGRTLRGKAWSASGSEPYDWHKEFVIPDGQAETLLTQDAAGWVGVRSSLVGGNTNGPITISYDNFEILSPEFFGEVSEWPQTRDTSGEDRTVEIEASGLLRRMRQGQSLLQSAPRRFIPTDGQGVSEVQFYWPLEDGPLVADGQPVIGSVPLRLTSNTAPERVFGQGTLAPWLAPSVQLPGPDVFSTVPDINMSGFSAASGWMFDFIRYEGVQQDTAFQLLCGVAGAFDVVFDVSAQTISVTDDTATTNTVYPVAFDGGTHHIRFEANGSGTITWALLIDNELVSARSYAGTLEPIIFILFSNAAGSNPMSIGHVAVYNGSFSTGAFEASDAAFGFRGEGALDRYIRLSGENSIPISYFDSGVPEAEMGPQSVRTVLDLMEQCVDTDGGLLSEPRQGLGLVMRTLGSMYKRSSWATMSLAAGELSPPWKPVPDDRYIKNQITAERIDGGSYTYAKTSGKLSTLDPSQGGVGVYDDTVRLSINTDEQLVNQASWRVHAGTVDEERYPGVVVELHREQIFVDNPTLYNRLMDLDAGDQITLADLDATGIYDDPQQVVIGYEKFLSRFNHTITMTCAPASAFRVATFDDTDIRFDSDGSVLDVAVTSSATSMKVRASDCTWTTAAGNMPIALKVSGEEVSATAVGSATPTFVAAGAAAHADNASVTPGLPAGLAAGDLLLVLAAIRNNGTGTVDLPAGYTELGVISNLRLMAKYAAAGEAAPTVAFSGGAAGATCSAQMAAFRGASLTSAGTNGQTNSSAQDIAFPRASLPSGPNLLVIYAGWKQDDWTSVATVTGATEIGEPSSTLGSDQGLVWDYQVMPGNGSTENGSFVVTGGASAISIGLVVAQYVTQDFTVTRSVNGVVKAQVADAPISLARPSYFGL